MHSVDKSVLVNESCYRLRSIEAWGKALDWSLASSVLDIKSPYFIKSVINTLLCELLLSPFSLQNSESVQRSTTIKAARLTNVSELAYNSQLSRWSPGKCDSTYSLKQLVRIHVSSFYDLGEHSTS